MIDENQMSSQAWLLRGLTGSLPGKLTLAHRHLSYTAHGFGTLYKRQLEKIEQAADHPGLAERLNNAQSTVIFSVPVTDTRALFPWYYFSGGMKVLTAGRMFRFSFARPNAHAMVGAGPGISEARKIGNGWRSLLL